MDELLWKSMPEDCIDKILVRLPLPSAFRLRSVCKRWKSFIFSEAYFSLQSQLSSHRHCFLLCTQGHLACVYNFILEKWHYLPLPRIVLPITIPPLSLASASQSLFCFANQVAECSVLFICNPFTKSLKSLPAMSRIRFIHKVTVTVDPSDKSYKIMVAGEDGNQFSNPHVYKLLTEIYDSTTASWTMAGSPLPEAKFGSNPGVWCRGGFYCITEMPYGVVTFDMVAQSWKEIRAPMPACLATPSLVECRGRLLMGGRIKHKAGQRPDSIKIWELKGSSEMAWTEVVRMPDSLCREFLQPLHSLTPLVCAGIDNFICITTHLSPRVLIYDLSSSVWRWLPEDPLFPKCRNFHLLGFSLEPRMDTLP
ncbi:hypothetical protein O6H91_22G062900 [Diphasiastrum complanatum]|uniref:Uncharacterized protein n=1 Tax=Diphasiastrum complanatum TaxID=34168 RepID=A0ACC2AGI7_DIPCM|nr:hypothetical protein O6H91_22G062900 [Diphasiastrum complanatum]